MANLFTALERQAWGGFVATQGRLFQKIEDDLRQRFGITHTEFEVLLRLSMGPAEGVRIQDLAARSLLSPSGTSRVVGRLARAGFVTRQDVVEDGRGARATLTDLGRTHFQATAQAHVELVRKEFLSHFQADELEQMASFWARLEPTLS